MSTRSLPPRPNLEQLKIQARELHRAHREGQPSAAARILSHHPGMKGASVPAVLEKPLALADAQLVIAREYGFESWAKLKHHVELADVVATFSPHPRFDEAVAAMDHGDFDRLRSLIASDPALVQARTNLEPPYHYFTGATLLHHVAGNPDRGRLDGKRPPLPNNGPDIARLLLEAGADVHARTLGPNGGDTMGLLCTSKQASDADVTGPLMDVLLEYGAALDLTSEGCLDASLANHAPRAADKMIALGAKPEVLAAAALGRMDLLHGLFDSEGRLLSRPRRHGQEMSDRDAIGLALLYAYVREQPYRIDDTRNRIGVRHSLDDKDWDAIIASMAERRIAGFEANGQMTDEAMRRIAELDHVTALNLGGSNQLTDAGLQHLVRMPQLQELDLSGWEMRITDRGLEALRHLTELRRFQMCWPQHISDAGIANLAFCDHLESVDLLGTPTGDGAIAALSGKRRLRRVKTGRQVTDAGLALLHRFPVFETWLGGAPKYSLMSPDAEPTHLLLDGPFTNKGLANLAGLDGLFGLSFFWHISALTPDGLERLADLANLGFLGCEGKLCNDDAMRHIAAIPRLRMLMAQGTVASDAGFASLSRSQTIEYIWGRECPNLTGRGFAAMAAMPALRGLAVSCKHVDDHALSTLPRFPALRELMPMDVPDAGFRHVGRCEELLGLWCMYCRGTTDVATEHIAGLSKLRTYYAGQTKITDRSLDILSRMPSLEKLEFWNCARITNAGVAKLAALPRLREISLDDCRQVTSEVAALFPAHVRVTHSA